MGSSKKSSISKYVIKYDAQLEKQCKIFNENPKNFKKQVESWLNPLISYFKTSYDKLPNPEFFASSSMFIGGEPGIGGVFGVDSDTGNLLIGLALDSVKTNQDYKGTVAHEFGHALLYQIGYRKNISIDANIKYMENGDVAKKIVTRAMNDIGEKSSSWKIQANTVTAQSTKGYASTSYDECVAEAVAMYSMYGNKSSKFALAIMRELRKSIDKKH